MIYIMIKRVLLLMLLLLQVNIIFSQVGKPFPNVDLWATNEEYIGNSIKSASLLEKGKRTLVCFFTTWCPHSITEFDYLYEKGVLDTCAAHNINAILITDKELPFKFEGRKPKGDWPDRLIRDFTICVDRRFSLLEAIKGGNSFPFTCIVEADSLISYCYEGFYTEKIDSLLKRLKSSHVEKCKNCNGTGINPKACRVCKGTGRCMLCYYDSDYYLHHCKSCDNSRICSICHDSEFKRKECIKCFGTGYK